MPTDTNAIIQRLGALFVESLHIEVPSADTDLFETGILDSLQLIELLLQLERCFDFQIKIEDIDLDDLRTLARIAELIAARKARAGSQMAQLPALKVRQAAVNQEGSRPELRPGGAEPMPGRVEGNRLSTIGSPRDSTPAGQPRRSGGAR